MKYRAAVSVISDAKNKKQTPQDFYNARPIPRCPSWR